MAERDRKNRIRDGIKDKKGPKWIVKKRTKSGIYITIATGNTRKAVIDKTIADSELFYPEREESDD